VADDKCADNVPAPAPQQSAGHNERIVHCVKFGRDLPGLDRIPWKGEIGKRVYENVSKDAWKMWLEHMKMLMNEYRLNLGTTEAQEFLLKQMDDYFFGAGAALPPDFVPPKQKS